MKCMMLNDVATHVLEEKSSFFDFDLSKEKDNQYV